MRLLCQFHLSPLFLLALSFLGVYKWWEHQFGTFEVCMDALVHLCNISTCFMSSFICRSLPCTSSHTHSNLVAFPRKYTVSQGILSLHPQTCRRVLRRRGILKGSPSMDFKWKISSVLIKYNNSY